MVQVRRYGQPPVDMAEVLRYAACRQATEEVEALAKAAVEEAKDAIRMQVCWLETPLQVEGERIDLGFLQAHTPTLANHLRGCEKAVVFGATVGLELDRRIARCGRLSPAKGLMLQAFGAERVEALCDAFCADLAAEYALQGLHTRTRFSPGYGDLPLEHQKEIFAALQCGKHIGLYLNDSCLMSPVKSVTAIVGLCREEGGGKNGCAVCTQKDCSFRRR